MAKHFSYETDTLLACPCCGARGMSDDFLDELDAIREEVGFPMAVNSGYRCPAYNAKISSTGPNGPHTTGKAVDIKANSRQKALILKSAACRGFTRFGVAKGFIHLDKLSNVDGFDDDVVWTY